MPSWMYYSLTLLLYSGCVLGGIFIKDIGRVFEFVGGFGSSLNTLMMPGLSYLLVLRLPRANLEIETDR